MMSFFNRWRRSEPPSPYPRDKSETELSPVNHKVFFYAGNSMGENSNIPIDRVIQDLFPEATEKSYPSVMLSHAMFKPNRFAEMEQDLGEALNGKGEITIIVYSLGATEFTTAFFKFLEKRRRYHQQHHEEFEALDLSKVHLILRSPSGLVQNWRDRWRQTLQFGRVMEGIFRGPLQQLENTITVPPRNEQNEFELDPVLAAMRLAYPRSSALLDFQKRAKSNEVQPLTPPLLEDYLQDEQYADLRKQLQTLDRELLTTAKRVLSDVTTDHLTAFRDVLETRTKLLQDRAVLADVMVGKGFFVPEDWQPTEQFTTWDKLAGIAQLGLFRVLRRSFMGENIELYRWFAGKGMKISVLIPEFEAFSPWSTIDDFFTLDPHEKREKILTQNFIMQEGTSHITLTNLSKPLADALRRLGDAVPK